MALLRKATSKNRFRRYEISQKGCFTLQIVTSRVESKRVNTVPEDREKNGSGIKQRIHKPVSEDTSSSDNGCNTLKEMLILCLVDHYHLNCWQSTSTGFCCRALCEAQQKPLEQGWEGSRSSHHSREPHSLVLI